MNKSEADYYEILELKSDASADDIKRSFQRIVKKCHPDKLPAELSSCDRIISTRHFHRVTQAYSVLSNQERKVKYDRKYNAESMAQEWPISEVLDLDDMTYDPAVGCYASSCRCGGCYMVSESELGEGVELVCCSTCSLSIRLLYKQEEAEEDVECVSA